MFSDTHFHFSLVNERLNGEGYNVLSQMALRNCKFGLDIGTKAGDLKDRQIAVQTAINRIDDTDLRKKAETFIHYSAGLWPDVEQIKNRAECMKILEQQILENLAGGKLVAVGEGGIDHHWNPSGADGRSEADFNDEIYYGEKELFKMQLELAKKLNLPVIVHSRDGFEDTLECIKEVGWNDGIIHCYSYGLEEARAFLEYGWHISFSGSVTYTKKNRYEDMKKLISYIPEDRLLCETDAPYLAPVPMRGQANTPVFVEHTYRYIAEIRGITAEKLSDIVDENSQKLFFGRS